MWWVSDVQKFRDHYPDWDYTRSLQDILDDRRGEQQRNIPHRVTFRGTLSRAPGLNPDCLVCDRRALDAEKAKLRKGEKFENGSIFGTGFGPVEGLDARPDVQADGGIEGKLALRRHAPVQPLVSTTR